MTEQLAATDEWGPCSVEEFHRQADPDRENLCLYGTNDGNWVVDLPAEEVPPEVPEPALGINFARDGMQVRERLFARARPLGAMTILLLDLLFRSAAVYSITQKLFPFEWTGQAASRTEA